MTSRAQRREGIGLSSGSVSRGSERSSALAKLFETDELLDLDEIAGPFHWPESIGGRSRSGMARPALLG